jgi:lipoprotein NlpI
VSKIKDVEKTNPMIINRQNNMDDWITVAKISDILEDSDVKYKSIKLS